MSIRKTAAVLVLAGALLVPGAALADNCFNVSRPGGDLSANPADFSGPVAKGNWVWLPSIGVEVAAWGFGPPANYQDGTSTPWLLANTKYCDQGGILFYGGPRTTDHGVQSGCGSFG